MTVLIVDDVVSNRMLLSKCVSNNFACVIHTAEDGLDAIRQIESDRPDLVLLDLQMPKMTGLEFLRIIRSKEAWRSLPVIIVTANADRKVFAQVSEQGIAGYILKPFSSATVRDQILHVLPQAPMLR